MNTAGLRFNCSHYAHNLLKACLLLMAGVIAGCSCPPGDSKAYTPSKSTADIVDLAGSMAGPKARFVGFVATDVKPDGTVDLWSRGGQVQYWFIAPATKKEADDINRDAMEMKSTHRYKASDPIKIELLVRQLSIKRQSMHTYKTYAKAYETVELPRCSMADLWKEAIKHGLRKDDRKLPMVFYGIESGYPTYTFMGQGSFRKVWTMRFDERCKHLSKEMEAKRRKARWERKKAREREKSGDPQKKVESPPQK